MLVSDARLLLLPVRSLSGSYRWTTCPLLLERLGRDLERMTGKKNDLPDVNGPKEGEYCGGDSGILYLEERSFSRHDGNLPDSLAEKLGAFIRHDATRERLADQLLLLHNKDFAWFARYALSVQARNVLHNKHKKSMNLWYEESLSPDTLLYALLGERVDDSGLDELEKLFKDQPYLQTGGNETVGMGWVSIRIWGGEQ